MLMLQGSTAAPVDYEGTHKNISGDAILTEAAECYRML